MPLFPSHPAADAVPVFNSACPWASSGEDLKALYNSPFTSAVTTRTSTLHGFPDDATKHQVAFFGRDAQSSSNSYGYSPYPLSQYLAWVKPLLASSAPKKLAILSITGNLEETKQMLITLQAFANVTKSTIAVEFNASCPNIKGHPPPAYDREELSLYVALLAQHASPNVKVGIKLPPYTYDGQFFSVVAALSQSSPKSGDHPISFLTATNTLGQGLVFSGQAVPTASAPLKSSDDTFALPGGFGGLAGAALHQLALGNVYKLSSLLTEDKVLSTITIIGVGGVADLASIERYRLAGADAVACATAFGREGVDVFSTLVSGAPPVKLVSAQVQAHL